MITGKPPRRILRILAASLGTLMLAQALFVNAETDSVLTAESNIGSFKNILADMVYNIDTVNSNYLDSAEQSNSPIPRFAAAGTVVINEVCAKNTTKAAPDGEFYDYVELYNAGSSAVNLSSYRLSDDESMPDAYCFPEGTSIASKGYLVVYCGVSEETDAFCGATFGLSKNGETLILSDASAVAETFSFPALADNTAYGRTPDGADAFAVLASLSPNGANPSKAVVSIEPPRFSKDSGFYADSFSLTLSAPSGTKIYYTTDGSEPTTDSAVYADAISIYDRIEDPPVLAAETDIAESYKMPSTPIDRAMIVRAIAVNAEGKCSAVETNSYFIGYSDEDFITNMRVISLVTDPDNLFDYETGIYVWGKEHDDWVNGSSYDPYVPEYEQPGNFTQHGREWERPAHFSVFENGTETFSQDVGIRIHGGATRSAPQKSFNIYARSDYSATKLDYDFFGGTVCNEVDGKPITSFDSLMLRNGGNDKETKIRDRLNQELVSDRSFGTLAQTECVVFLDGEFWGMYNLMEKISKDYIADHYDVKADSVCVAKNFELADGSEAGLADYEALQTWAMEAYYDEPETYETFKKLCDPVSFADYMATEIIVGNDDFGWNNFSLWKTETVQEGSEYGDGRWRFLLFDTEFGQGLYGSSNANTSTLNSLYGMHAWLTNMFFGLFNNSEEFRELFLTCYYDQLNQNFKAEIALKRLAELEAAFAAPMAETLRRFPSGWAFSPDNVDRQFANEVNTIRDFYRRRDASAKTIMYNYLKRNIKDFKAEMQTIDVFSSPMRGTVRLNTLTLDMSDGAWQGTYLTQYPITLSVQAKDGYAFSDWEITGATLAAGYSEKDSEISLSLTQEGASVFAAYTKTQGGIIGDGTGDGKVNAEDVKQLRDWLMCRAVSVTAKQADSLDMDGNGCLTSKDLSLLTRAVLYA